MSLYSECEQDSSDYSDDDIEYSDERAYYEWLQKVIINGEVEGLLKDEEIKLSHILKEEREYTTYSMIFNSNNGVMEQLQKLLTDGKVQPSMKEVNFFIVELANIMTYSQSIEAMEKLRHQSQEFKDVLQKIKNMMKVLNSNATSKDVLDFAGHMAQHIQEMFLEDCLTNLSLSVDQPNVSQHDQVKKFLLTLLGNSQFSDSPITLDVTDRIIIVTMDRGYNNFAICKLFYMLKNVFLNGTLKSSYLNPHDHCINASGYGTYPEFKQNIEEDGVSLHMIISTADLKVQNKNPANLMTFTGIRQRPGIPFWIVIRKHLVTSTVAVILVRAFANDTLWARMIASGYEEESMSFVDGLIWTEKE
eukprot:Pgem_evm1s18659